MSTSIKEVLITIDTNGVPTTAQQAEATALANQLESDYPGVNVCTQNRAGSPQPPRKKLPTFYPQ